MKIITGETLRQVSEAAAGSPRLRKNYNLHPADTSRCHRLLNAIEPGTYIRPHRHLDPEKDESFILMCGRLAVILFADDGQVTESVVLSRENDTLVADVPSGLYHTAVSLQPGTVFFEAKAGPYLPLSEAEVATWAPPEGDGAAPGYLEGLRALVAS